ncbi:hypothetical protein ACFLZN_01250, partial [Nanoarchaeota archaeon]
MSLLPFSAPNRRPKEHVEKMLKKHPNSAMLLKEKAENLAEKNKKQLALAALEKAKKKGLDKFSYYDSLVYIMRAVQDKSGEIRALQSLIKLRPKDITS